MNFTPNIQSNIEQEQSWSDHSSWFQNLLQSDSNQSSMVLAWKQTYRPMEENEKPEINSWIYG